MHVCVFYTPASSNSDKQRSRLPIPNPTYIDISIEIEATPDDVDAMLGMQDVKFAPGNVVGKLMAFINQVRLCNADTGDFLRDQCISQGCGPFELKLWVRTCWGSLYDCFQQALDVHPVYIPIIWTWIRTNVVTGYRSVLSSSWPHNKDSTSGREKKVDSFQIGWQWVANNWTIL